ncbi:MAG: DUF930 domain-containing protein [Pseudolabrys sp.]
MRVLGLAFGLAVVVAAQAAAADARFEKSLQMLAPEERLEQLCDYTAMAEIRKHPGKYRPDRAIANAMAEPTVGKDKLETKGGAFRSRGKWYAMSFSCAVSPDHLQVTSFHFTIGDEIPETKWAAYHLWD